MTIVGPDKQGLRPNRRTVVRGAAWTVPVVAVAASAPAFATSPTPPDFGKLTACKLPGQSTDTPFGYLFTVPYNGLLTQLSLVMLTLNGAVKTPTCVRIEGPNLKFEVQSANSADASGDGTIVFTFNDVEYTASFQYNGTKPCKGETGGCA